MRLQARRGTVLHSIDPPGRCPAAVFPGMRIRVPYLIIGVIALAIGALWTLQGAGVLAGSAMSGQSLWLGIGIVLLMAGLVLGYLGLRGSAGRPGG